jgi:hypothetical protein
LVVVVQVVVELAQESVEEVAQGLAQEWGLGLEQQLEVASDMV